MSWTALKALTVLMWSMLVWLVSWSVALTCRWMRAAAWLLDQLWLVVKWLGRVVFVVPARAMWKRARSARRVVVAAAVAAWKASRAVGRRTRKVLADAGRRLRAAVRRSRVRMRKARRRVTRRLAEMWRR
jgi:hypothetical protein